MERSSMHYGKTAAKLIAALVGVVILLMVLRPGWGSPGRTLVGPLVVLFPPMALALSIAGVMRDERKLCAAIMLAISGAITVFFLWGLLEDLFC